MYLLVIISSIIIVIGKIFFRVFESFKFWGLIFVKMGERVLVWDKIIFFLSFFFCEMRYSGLFWVFYEL